MKYEPGYTRLGQKVDYSVSFAKGNLVGIPFALVPFFLLIFGHWWVHGTFDFIPAFINVGWVAVVAIFLLGTVTHELLHAAGFVMFGHVEWSQITIGMHWKAVSAYAHCREPVRVFVYRIALALPFLMLGLLPGIAGITLNIPALTAWGAIFAAVAGGDLLVLWLIRAIPGDQWILDHSTRVGCVVFEDADTVS